jgi:hypothetical protein
VANQSSHFVVVLVFFAALMKATCWQGAVCFAARKCGDSDQPEPLLHFVAVRLKLLTKVRKVLVGSAASWFCMTLRARELCLRSECW